MSLESPQSVKNKTSIDQKLHSKNAAKSYRFGSPKLRDLLREKCRLRARDARQKHFDDVRSFSDGENAQNTTYNLILREEIAQLEADIVMQEEIYKELLDEVNDWFAEQLLEEDNYLISIAESDEIFCPICQKHVLTYDPSAIDVTANVGLPTILYKCECGKQFYFDGGHEELRLTLKHLIDEHEQKCQQPLRFFEMPAKFLNAMCDYCHFFYGIRTELGNVEKLP